jgi:WD40 repeat protein
VKALSKSNEVVYTINSKDIYRVDVEKQTEFNIGKTQKRAACMTVTSLETSSNRVEEIVIIGDRGGDVYAHSLVENSSKKRFLCGHTASILTDVLVTEISPKTNMRYLITSDKDEKIRVSEFPSSFHIRAHGLGHTRSVQALQNVHGAVHSSAREVVYDGNELFISGGQDGTLRVWHLLSGTLLSTFYLDEKAAEASVQVLAARSGLKHASYLAHNDADMNHSHEAAADDDSNNHGDSDPSESVEDSVKDSSSHTARVQSESPADSTSKLIIPAAYVVRNLEDMKPATIYDSPTHIRLVGLNEIGNPIYVCCVQNQTRLAFFSLHAHPPQERAYIPSTNEKGVSYPQILVEKISGLANVDFPGNVLSLEKLGESQIYLAGGFFGSNGRHEIKAVKIDLSNSNGKIFPSCSLIDPQPAFVVQLNAAIQSCPIPVAPVLTFDGN